MRRWSGFYGRGEFRRMGGKFLVIVLLSFTFCFVLNSVVSAAKPWDEPIRPVTMCDPGANRSGPKAVPPQDSLSSPPGDRSTGSYPKVYREEGMRIETESRSPAPPWVVWFDFLITLFK